MRQKRTKKEIKNDRQDYLGGLAARCTNDRAWWHFYRRPYSMWELSKQARRLIRAQGAQIFKAGDVDAG